MATRPSNGVILEDLKLGLAEFELVSSPFPTIATHRSRNAVQPLFISDDSHLFFAKRNIIFDFPWTASKNQVSPESSKAETYRFQKVTADGRNMFRALAIGMAKNDDCILTTKEETGRADALRRAIHNVLCTGDTVLHEYEEELKAITEPLKSYCERIKQPDFCGGEPELKVLSKLYHQPISVYRREHEDAATYGSGLELIADYGTEYGKRSKLEKPKKVVSLLYNGSDHYDVLA